MDKDGLRAATWSIMERMVWVNPNYQLWVEDRGHAHATPILLIMGANYSAAAWPEDLLDRLAIQHRVIRYDHRDTGRSSQAFEAHPYPIRDLASDAIAVLDALDIPRAHVVGMSLGGVLVQLLLLDHPERLLSASVFATTALGSGLADASNQDTVLPEPDPRLLDLWQEMGEDRGPDEEIAWRIEHWRLLNGDTLPFDPEEFAALERRIVEHSGTHQLGTAHARADESNLDRGAELATVTTPTMVIDAPQDPVNPPPHAEHLAGKIHGSHRTIVPGMGHALSTAVIAPLTAAILTHTTTVDAETNPPAS